MEEEKETTKRIAILTAGFVIGIAIFASTTAVYNKFEWQHEQEMAKAGYVQEYKEYGRKVWVKQQ
jgi:protein-S-isoprenylcysteine O-methyltransferase Ste14